MKKTTLLFLSALCLVLTQALQAQELLGDFEEGSTPSILFNTKTAHTITTTSKYPYIKVYLDGGVFSDTQTTYKTFFTNSKVSFNVLWNDCEAFEKGSGSFKVIFTGNIYYGNNYSYSLKTVLPKLNYLLFNEYSFKPAPHQEYCSTKQKELDAYFTTIYADCKTLDIDAIIAKFDPTGCCNLTTNFCKSTIENDACEQAQKDIDTAIANKSLSTYSKIMKYINIRNANPECTDLVFKM